MIIFHRLTPFAITLANFTGFLFLIFAPFDLYLPATFLFALTPFLLGRLLLWELRRPGFWIFLGLPTLLLISALAFFLLLDFNTAKWTVAIIVSSLLLLYTENIFTFYHAPSHYQAYALEHLSIILSFVGIYFFGSAIFLAETFLEVPFWAGTIFIGFLTAVFGLAVLWTSKVSYDYSRPRAALLGVLMAQIHFAIYWLTIGFSASAALLTVAFACTLLYIRDESHDTLSKTRKIQYGVLGLASVLLIGLTSIWL